MYSIRADLEHEIPNGSRLYFGESARVKRELESFAAKVLTRQDFEEIVTPFFSYHQHLSVRSEDIISVKDITNHPIALRADSTVDATRIVLRRIKDENLKRLFYIQPVFKFPNSEIYQIGAELIGERNLAKCLSIATQILENFTLEYSVQISNIEIPRLVSKILEIPIEIFEKGDINFLLNLKNEWINALLSLVNLNDIKRVKRVVPKELLEPLDAMESLALTHKNATNSVKLSPLYYSKMRYYDKLFFRFISSNSILCSGGDYEIDRLESSGFGIMTDQVLEKILENGGKK